MLVVEREALLGLSEPSAVVCERIFRQRGALVIFFRDDYVSFRGNLLNAVGHLCWLLLLLFVVLVVNN